MHALGAGPQNGCRALWRAHVLAGAQNAIPVNYTQFLQAGGLAGARVGVLRQLSNTPTADPELLGIFDAALASMAQQGACASDFWVSMAHELRSSCMAQTLRAPAAGHRPPCLQPVPRRRRHRGELHHRWQ